MSIEEVSAEPLQPHIHDEVNQWILQMAVDVYGAKQPVIATTAGSMEPFVVDEDGRFWRLKLHAV